MGEYYDMAVDSADSIYAVGWYDDAPMSSANRDWTSVGFCSGSDPLVQRLKQLAWLVTWMSRKRSRNAQLVVAVEF